MPWLMRDGDVLATLEVVESISHRTRGLLGREGIKGALLLRPARWVHTIGMKFPIDVAFCSSEMRVVATARMPPYRLSLPRLKARCVIEAEAGSFERWNLHLGDTLEVGNG